MICRKKVSAGGGEAGGASLVRLNSLIGKSPSFACVRLALVVKISKGPSLFPDFCILFHVHLVLLGERLHIKASFNLAL